MALERTGYGNFSAKRLWIFVLWTASSMPTAPKSVAQITAPVFEVAAIRPMDYAGNARTHISNSPRNGNLQATNVNLKALLEVAYDIPDTRMFGGPDWINAQKYDLEARSSDEVDTQIAALPPDQGKQAKRKMLQALLIDRFKLVVHIETRQMPIYALVIVKNGAKSSNPYADADAIPAGRSQITIPAADDAMAILAYELSWRLGRPVLDRTGLKERRALTLRWTDDAASDNSGGASLFTAIQEQLGLKLEPAKGAVPVILIDHVEKPSAN